MTIHVRHFISMVVDDAVDCLGEVPAWLLGP